MKIMTYKRTHIGDPDNRGIFGINDCMGSVRNRAFDAVVGIGSKSPWADSQEIAGKVTWVGVGPIRSRQSDRRGDLMTFESFILLDGEGPDFEKVAPNLAKRFYQGNARSILHSYSATEKQELERLITDLLSLEKCRKNPVNTGKDKLAERRDKCARKFSEKHPPLC